MPYLSPIFLRRLLQNYDFALNVGTSLCDVVLVISSLINQTKTRPCA